MLSFAYVEGIGWRAIIEPSITILGVKFSYMYIIPLSLTAKLAVLALAITLSLFAGPYILNSLVTDAEQSPDAMRMLWQNWLKFVDFAIQVISRPFRYLQHRFLNQPNDPVELRSNVFMTNGTETPLTLSVPNSPESQWSEDLVSGGDVSPMRYQFVNTLHLSSPLKSDRGREEQESEDSDEDTDSEFSLGPSKYVFGNS